MANTEYFTSVIDEVEKLDPSKNGWDKYNVFFEGEDKAYPVAVPADFTHVIQLEQGMEITVSKGPWKDWIVNTKNFESDGDSDTGSSRRSSGSSEGRSRRSTSSESTPSRRSTSRSSAKTQDPIRTTKGSGKDYAPSEHQLEVNRKIEMQAYLKICTDVFCAVETSGSGNDPHVIVDEVIERAQEMFDTLNK